MSNENELNEALEFSKNLESNQNLTQANALRVEDLTELANPYLSEASLEALSKKATQQVIQVPGTMDAFMAIYMASIYKASSKEAGAKKMAENLNKLSEKGLIHSVLAPISYIALARSPGQEETIAVFCFPLVPTNRMEEVNALVKHNQEGSVGELEEDVGLKLSEGQFIANIRLSCVLSAGLMGHEERLQYQINEYLAILPKGTEVVETIKCAITDLSIPYTVVFRNPLMADFREVRIDYRRTIVQLGDKVEQFNLLKDVTYIRHDGTEI